MNPLLLVLAVLAVLTSAAVAGASEAPAEPTDEGPRRSGAPWVFARTAFAR